MRNSRISAILFVRNIVIRLQWQLKKAGIVKVVRGSEGTDMARTIDEITLLAIFILDQRLIHNHTRYYEGCGKACIEA